jgi:hypothetical protein
MLSYNLTREIVRKEIIQIETVRVETFWEFLNRQWNFLKTRIQKWQS